MSDFPRRVKIVEVGPRDGLQNESTILSTEVKARYIELLLQSGLKTVEATSFVRKEKIPQMGDASILYPEVKKLNAKYGAAIPCLVPNTIGLENAINVGVKEIAIFTATSNQFNQKNINATIDGSFERLSKVAAVARSNKMKIRAYVSTVFGCPYEGETSLETLEEVVTRLVDLGAYEISLGDTIGVGHPLLVRKVLERLCSKFDKKLFAMHFHDTYGMALVNAMTSLEYGISTFDSSSAGLGGCPYAQGATGNVATEDLLYLFDKLGIETGVDMTKLMQAGEYILSHMPNRTSASRVYQALSNKKTN